MFGALTRLKRRRKRKNVPELLGTQISLVLQGLDIFAQVTQTTAPTDELRKTMSKVEHAGDRAREAFIQRMAQALSTHLEREDLFRASRSIDDVLDNLRDFVRESVLWDTTATTHMRLAEAPIRSSLESLKNAVTTTDLSDAQLHCLEARKAAGSLRRVYQEALVEIFEDDLTMDTLKSRELMRRIDIIGLRLSEASDALLDGLVKRSN